jgi:hypothetical protein
MFWIVPNWLRDELYARLDAQIEQCPQALPDREEIYHRLLRHFDEHGTIPDFELTATT